MSIALFKFFYYIKTFPVDYATWLTNPFFFINIINMANQKGQNQSSARNANLALIMERFERQSMSRADISRIFHLSKPAASKITAELESLGLIRVSPNEITYNQPGVRPVYYEINPDLGIIAVIDLSTVEVKINICDFSGAILSQNVIFDMEVIEYKDFMRFRDCLKKVLSSKPLKDKKLLSICVAMPCQVNKITGKVLWSPRFNIHDDFDVYDFFTHEFTVKTIIRNDVQLYLYAEQEMGLITQDVKYALLVYVDAGIGGSFYFDSKIESGEDGTAGDIGFYNVEDEGRFITLDSAASINAIMQKLKRRISSGETCSLSPSNIHFKDILNAYKSGDKLVKEVVNNSAKVLANALVNFINIFNINCIVINGRIKHLGKEYLDIIKNIVCGTFPRVTVDFSKIESAACEGAYIVSRIEIIKDIIKSRK